jgi:hypothetical protein
MMARFGKLGLSVGLISVQTLAFSDSQSNNPIDRLKQTFDLEKLSREAYENINGGSAGQVGYGFLMGYTSGFFLKKVIKVDADFIE